MGKLIAMMLKSKHVGTKHHPVLTNTSLSHKAWKYRNWHAGDTLFGQKVFSFTRLNLLSICKRCLLLRSVSTIPFRRICRDGKTDGNDG